MNDNKTNYSMEQINAFKNKEDLLEVGGKVLKSRLLLGTGKYGSLEQMNEAMQASGSSMITVALRRIESNIINFNSEVGKPAGGLLSYIPKWQKGEEGSDYPVEILPNTSGARNSTEAVLAAEMARELLQTDFVKLEIHPDPQHLMPDPVETLIAAEKLVEKGFIVLPYVHADPVLCKRLESVGVAAVMPLGSPIGSNMGLKSREFLELIIDAATVPVIVDAGIGRPSDAALAMEIGADAVLVSTAIATALDPVLMAAAFKQAVNAGRKAYLAGLGSAGMLGEATSPLTEFLS